MSIFSIFKRPDDSMELSAILLAAKTSIDTRKTQSIPKVSQGTIRRFFSKYGDNDLAVKYGIGVPFIDWGVVRHPLLNAGQPVTLRFNPKDEVTHVEAAPGEAWWLLTDRLWLGRRGTAPGLPKSLPLNNGCGGPSMTDEEDMCAVEDVAMLYLITSLGLDGETLELPSLRYDIISDFACGHNFSAEWSPDYDGLRFWFMSRKSEYMVSVKNLEPAKEGDGGVRMSATKTRPEPVTAKPKPTETDTA